jgi:hypothetical protein
LALTTECSDATHAPGAFAYPSTPHILSWKLAPQVTPNDLQDVYMVSSTDGWAVGEGGTVLHYDGSAWTSVDISTTDRLRDVFMLDANHGYMLGWVGTSGGSDLFHWDGSSWTLVYHNPTTYAFQRVDAITDNDVWIAAQFGRIYHWDGVNMDISWNDPLLRTVFAVRMISATEGWAVGAYNASTGGLILHYTGGVWTDYSPSPAPRVLYDDFFWRGVPNEGWAIGFGAGLSYILHYDGIQWAVVYTPTEQYSRIFMLTPSDGWTVGFDPNNAHGVVAHYDGTSLVEANNPTTEILNGLYMLSSTDGWAVGTGGTMLHYYEDGTPSPTVTATATATATGTATPTATRTPTVAPSGTAPPASSTVTRTSTPVASPTSCTITFSDVPQDSTFYPYIRCLACRGILSGYNDGTFRPGNDVTRGQLSKIVSNAADFQDIIPGSQQTFTDVPSNNPFWLWIERMVGHSVISGYPCGGPNEPCDQQNRPYFRWGANATRGQISKIVSNAKGFGNEVPPDQQTFTDVPSSNPFWVWIERLAERGIMSGYQCGGPNEPCDQQNRPYFRWGNNATRGQTAKIVSNTFFPGCVTPARR